MLCSCVSGVPFGREMRGVDVFSVDYVMVCGFRVGVEAKRNGGGVLVLSCEPGFGVNRTFVGVTILGNQNYNGQNG